MIRIADVLVSMRPHGLRVVGLTGGEPLLIPGLPVIIDRLLAGGLEVYVNTSSSVFSEELARALNPACDINVSVDGVTPETHDRIRGRDGSFQACQNALRILNTVALEQRAAGTRVVRFGIDVVLVRSNFDEAVEMVRQFSEQISELAFIQFGAVIPIGAASSESYSHELLTPDQLQTLVDPAFARHLRSLCRPELLINVSDNREYRMAPGQANPCLMTLEPDGSVRALTAYEGSVGNILQESPFDLWASVCERRNHPFVSECLSKVTNAVEWAAAAREIDRYFVTEADLARISRRSRTASSGRNE